MEKAGHQLIRNRNVAMMVVALAALLWLNGLRRFVAFLRGWRLRPWHFLDALGQSAWVGYTLIGLFFLGLAVGLICSTSGKERVLSACLSVDLLLMPLTHLCVGSLLVFVQYFVVAIRTAMLVTAVLVLHAHWAVAESQQE